MATIRSIFACGCVVLALGLGCVSSEGADPGGDGAGAQSGTLHKYQWDMTSESNTGPLDITIVTPDVRDPDSPYHDIFETDASIEIQVKNPKENSSTVYVDALSVKLLEEAGREVYKTEAAQNEFEQQVQVVFPIGHTIEELGPGDSTTLQIRPQPGKLLPLGFKTVMFDYSYAGTTQTIGNISKPVVSVISNLFLIEVGSEHVKVTLSEESVPDADGKIKVTCTFFNTRPTSGDGYTYYVSGRYVWDGAGGEYVVAEEKPMLSSSVSLSQMFAAVAPGEAYSYSGQVTPYSGPVPVPRDVILRGCSLGYWVGKDGALVVDNMNFVVDDHDWRE
jgi:hypothetical protein